MLGDQSLKAFIPTLQPGTSKNFYRDTLGLTLRSEDPYGMEFENNGCGLRVNTVQEFTPHPFTVLGWNVTGMREKMQFLESKGVQFEKYGFPGQDDAGVWTGPGGTMVAWFKDPDGNLLSLSEEK